MFTMQPRGLFGQRKPYGTPGIGDEIDPMKPQMGAPGIGLPAEAQQPQKMGLGSRLLGQGWEDKAMAIGGILQGDGGAAYRDMRESKLAPLMEQAKREAEWADWQRKEQWKRENPQPANNDTLNDMAAAATWTPEQWAIYDKLHPIYKIGADGVQYPMARGGIGAAPAVPTAPVGKLTPITGGPQANPAATFP